MTQCTATVHGSVIFFVEFSKSARITTVIRWSNLAAPAIERANILRGLGLIFCLGSDRLVWPVQPVEAFLCAQVYSIHQSMSGAKEQIGPPGVTHRYSPTGEGGFTPGASCAASPHTGCVVQCVLQQRQFNALLTAPQGASRVASSHCGEFGQSGNANANVNFSSSQLPTVTFAFPGLWAVCSNSH